MKCENDMVIRTEKHMTITEAHPFHIPVDPPKKWSCDPPPGNQLYSRGYDESCPLCREERETRRRGGGRPEKGK